jgi:phosphatidate cytidylyltransferase
VGNLASRVIVGVPLALVTLAAIRLGGWALVVWGVAAAVLACHELYGMARRLRPMVIAGQLGVIAIVIGAHWGGISWAALPIPITLFLSFLLAAGVAMRESATTSIAITLLGSTYIGLGVASLVLIRDTRGGRLGFDVLLAVVLGVWASDIFAYFGGRLFGRHKLAPAISPGKTVEGFVIGLVFGAAVIWWTLYGDPRITHTQAAVLGVVVAVVAPFGDLFESFLKRDLGVKDSGRLLGGHGGVLDRIDALLLAGPAALITLDLLHRLSIP